MDSERVSVVAADGHRYAVEVVAPEGGADAVVLVLPAMAVDAGYYKPVMDELAVMGFAAVAADWRGHGLSEIRARRGVDYGYHELVSVDLPATLAGIGGRFPGLPVVALGHSLGGQIASLHAAAHPGGLAGIALIASCTVHFSGWPFPANLALLLRTQIARPLVAAFGYFPGDKVGFAGPEGRQQMIDWAKNGLHGRYEVANSPFEFESLLRGVELPILAMTIDGDHYAPPRAQANLLAKMPAAAVTYHRFTTADMDPAGLDHIRWARHGAPVAAVIQRWVAANFR